MVITCQNDAWLAIALLLALCLGGILLLIIHRGQSAKSFFSRRSLLLLLPGLAAIFLLLGLLNPILIWSSPAKKIVVLLDCSARARTSPWKNPTWLRQTLRQHLPVGTRVEVLAVGTSVLPLIEDQAWLEPGQNQNNNWGAHWGKNQFEQPGTNLAAGLAWRTDAELAHPEEGLAPRWIFTDGLANLSPLLDARKTQPIELALTLVPPSAVDAGISQMEIRHSGNPLTMSPPTAATASAVELWVEIKTTGPKLVPLEIRRNQVLIHRESLEFTVPQGSSRLLSLRDTPPDTNTPNVYEVKLLSHDPWPEDDLASALAPAPEHPQLLVLTTHPKTWAPTFTTGKAVTITSPNAVTGNLLENFSHGGGGIVVLDDLARQQLPYGIGEALDRAVREQGMGLLILGREHAFGPGDYAGGEAGNQRILEQLSPLASLLPPAQAPPRTLIIMLDASGSMGERAAGHETKKFTLAASATLQALRSLNARDQVSIMIFDGQAHILAEGSPPGIAATLTSASSSVQPDGPTNPNSLLPLLENSAATKNRLLVLLTDGQIPSLEVDRWAKLLQAHGDQLTIIAPPPTPTTTSAPSHPPQPLAELAQKVNATWLTTDQPTQWAPLLRQAVEAPIRGKAQTTPSTWTATAEAQSLLGALFKEPIRSSTWITTWPRLDATTLIRSSTDPNLAGAAIAQRGLGRVAAVSFYAESPAYPALLNTLIQQIAPSSDDARFTLQAFPPAASAGEHPSRGWQIQVLATEGSKFLNQEQLALRIWQSSQGTASSTPPLLLNQTAPGTYSGTLTLNNHDAWAGTVYRILPDLREALVGRLQVPQIASPDFPATVQRTTVPAFEQGITLIPLPANITAQSPAQIWQPQLVGQTYSLRGPCWLLGTLCLTFMFLLRGPQLLAARFSHI